MRMLVITCLLVCGFAMGCARPHGTSTHGERGLESESDGDDFQALQGTWRIVSGVDRGKPVTADQLGNGEFEFQGATLIGRADGKELFRGGFKLDLSQTPRVLRIENRDPGGELPVREAIYEVKGDTLKFAFTKKIDGQRPTSFELEAGADVQLFVFARKP